MRATMQFHTGTAVYRPRTFTFSVDITGLEDDEAWDLQRLLDNATDSVGDAFGPIQERLSAALRDARIYHTEFDREVK